MSIEGQSDHFSSVESLSLYSISGWDMVVTFDYFSFTREYTAHSGSHRKVWEKGESWRERERERERERVRMD